MNKITIIIVLILFSINSYCTTKFNDTFDYDISGDLSFTKIGGSSGSQLCVGDSILIYSNVGVPRFSDHFVCNPMNIIRTDISINWSGISYYFKGVRDVSDYYGTHKPYIKCVITNNTNTVSISLTYTHQVDGPCWPGPYTSVSTYHGQITINANTTPPPPSLSTELFGTNLIKITASGCDSPANIIWNPNLSNTNQIIVPSNPTNCEVYKASCTLNGCTSPVSRKTVAPPIGTIPIPVIVSNITTSATGAKNLTLSASGCNGFEVGWTPKSAGDGISINLANPSNCQSITAHCQTYVCDNPYPIPGGESNAITPASVFVGSDSRPDKSNTNTDGQVMSHFSNIDGQYKLYGNNNFEVTADGSDISNFSIGGGAYDYANIGVRIKGSDGDSEQFGQINISGQGTNGIALTYQHPTYISGTDNRKNLGFELFDKNTGSVLKTYPLTVYPAPVLMAHGLNSNGASFDKMKEKLSACDNCGRFTGDVGNALATTVDYSFSNSDNFSANANVIPDAITSQLTNLRNMGIAVGKTNLFGHSMGGLLERLYIQSANFRNDVQRLVTINTPHSGTPLTSETPNLANAISWILNFKRYIFGGGGHNGRYGANEDLGVNSDAMNNLVNGTTLHNSNRVPIHAIATYMQYSSPTTTSPDFELAFTQSVEDKIYNNIRGPYNLIPYFDEITVNDGAVSRESQLGGLSGNCKTEIPNQVHQSSQANDDVINTSCSLLRQNPSGNSFCKDGFYPNQNGMRKSNISDSKIGLLTTNTTGTFIINSPIRDSKLTGNLLLNVNVQGIDLVHIQVLINGTIDSTYICRALGNNINYSFNLNKDSGRRNVLIIAKTNSGEILTDSTHFFVIGKCESNKSGNWNSSETWSCGRVPTLFDDVIINSGHNVKLTPIMGRQYCRIFKVNVGAIFENSADLFLAKPD